MSKRWNRAETWLGLIVLGIGGVILAVGGLWIYVSATATPLHPDAASVPSAAQADPARQWATAVEQARQAARTAVAEQNLPGLSVAVGVGDQFAWAEGFGWANLEKRVPAAPHTRFRIGTASIALTSAAVGLLLEGGKLSLDDEIQKHVPEFPKKKWPVTLRHLMGHQAGVRSDGGDEGPLFSQQCDRPVDAFQHFADGDLRFEPGTEYRYTRFGWIVVSAAVEAAAQEPFLTFMQKKVFAPLGMNDTLADSTTEPISDFAMSYFPRFAADPRYGPDPMRDIGLSCYSGGGVFLSTASDLVRFGMAINGGKLLQPATVDLLQTSQRLPSGEETGYGLGWDLETVTLLGEQTRAVGHDGDALGGIVASLMTFRERRLVVAVISNTSYADTPAVALRIAEAFVENGKRP
jgi:CubicO group peptidase (beta-lactamase class C family)